MLKTVLDYQEDYEYVHLISSVDMPLMTKEYFKGYFSKDLYLGFLPNDLVKVDKIRNRLRYFWPTDYLNARNRYGKLLMKLSETLNGLLRIDRIKNKPISIGKGSNWFSIKYNFIPKIMDYPNMSIFKYSLCADEMFLQTILNSYNPNISMDDNEMAARYIDWERGQPYTFTMNDVEELKQLVNTKYAFARKIGDPEIVDKVFEE